MTETAMALLLQYNTEHSSRAFLGGDELPRSNLGADSSEFGDHKNPSRASLEISSI